MPTILKIASFHHSDFLLNAPTDVSNGLDPVSSLLNAPTNVSNSLDPVSSSLNAPTNVFNGLDPVSPSLTAPMDVSNNLDFVSFPPVSAVHPAGDVVSIEAMLSKGKLEYDFDVTLGKAVAGNLTGRGKESTLQGYLSDYSKLFDQLLSDPGNCGLKINFYVMRLKSDTLLIERLLRDFIKRVYIGSEIAENLKSYLLSWTKLRRRRR